MAGVAQRDKKKEAKWRQQVAEQASGNLPVRAYCRVRGLSENSFYWWRRELARRERENPAAAAPAFVPLRVMGVPPEMPAVTTGGIVEIILPGERRVRLTGSVDRQQLAAVLDVLEMALRSENRKETGGC